MKKYSLTDKHRAQLKPWADRWIANAMSCKAMDDRDREAIRIAINGLYDAAHLPRPVNIIFVPSPLVARIASGFAAAIWWLREHNVATAAATYAATRDATAAATRDATYVATDDATDVATYAATAAATYAATRAATDDATAAATRAATDDATAAATDDATDVATRDATYAATRDATYAATHDAPPLTIGWAKKIARKFLVNHIEFMCRCAQDSWRMANGGNHWSGWVAYLSFFRHIVGLKLPVYDGFQHYENAAIHGSWRYMHPKFCIVSDRPEFIKIDDQNRSHCENGPSHQWRDGWKLYHWHGVRIPAEWIEQKDQLTPKIALTWENIEQRRAACELIGWERILLELNAEIINDSGDPEIGVLVRVDIPEIGREKFLRVQCATGRRFALPVPPDMRTALQANAWTYNLDEYEFTKPEVRT